MSRAARRAMDAAGFTPAEGASFAYIGNGTKSQAWNSSDTQVTVDAPDGVANGDTVFVWATGVVAVSPPGGEGFSLVATYDNGSTGHYARLFQKTSDGSEPANYVFTHSAGKTLAYAFAYAGGLVEHVEGTWFDNGGFNATHDPASIVTTEDALVLVLYEGYPTGDPTPTATSFTRRFFGDHNGNMPGVVGIFDSDGFEPAGTISQSFTTLGNVWSSAVLIAFTPA